MDLVAWGWSKLLVQPVVGPNANAFIGFVDIPSLNLFLTMRTRVSVFVAGTVTTRVRFGMQDGDALLSVQGIDFATLAVLDASSLASINWGGIAPGPPGSAPGMMPPRVAVFIDSPAGTDLTLELSAAAVQATG